MKILQRVCLGLFAALIVSNSLQAHEFWMEPENPSVSVGDTLKNWRRIGMSCSPSTDALLLPLIL